MFQTDVRSQEVVATSPGENEALARFTLFPKLPAELQIKIWEHAIPPPRLFRINVQVTSVKSSSAPIPLYLVC
jgi:hypothetical protein